MFAILAEPDRWNAPTPQDFANGARRWRLAAIRAGLDAALPPSRQATEADRYWRELASD